MSTPDPSIEFAVIALADIETGMDFLHMAASVAKSSLEQYRDTGQFEALTTAMTSPNRMHMECRGIIETSRSVQALLGRAN